MWVVLVTLVAQMQPAECVRPADRDTPPTLVVQVVDQLWLPIPGALVRVRPSSPHGSRGEARTDSEGYARFWLPGEGDYAVEGSLQYFKPKHVKGLHLSNASSSSSTAYVQLRLAYSGPKATVE